MEILKFLESGEHLPDRMRDFHDQKNLFKSMHYLFQDAESEDKVPNWRDGHVYVIDWFLWFMASRGYTLQKCRKKGVEFLDWPDLNEILKEESGGTESDEYQKES